MEGNSTGQEGGTHKGPIGTRPIFPANPRPVGQDIRTDDGRGTERRWSDRAERERIFGIFFSFRSLMRSHFDGFVLQFCDNQISAVDRCDVAFLVDGQK